MIGKMGFAVVTAIDLVAVEISIVPETHGFRWRARLCKWRRTSRDVVSSMGFGARAERSSLLADFTELIVQSGRGPDRQEPKGADRQAIRQSGTPRCRRGHRCGGPGRRRRLAGWAYLLPCSSGQEVRPGRGRWHLIAKWVGEGKVWSLLLAGWREEEGEMGFLRPKH